ncbi:MAG: zinc ribbon domain-containing protein [Chloroflexi bacterium]|nr:zinc ribbon domain-containing protein [Chloroflexota bacterium]
MKKCMFSLLFVSMILLKPTNVQAQGDMTIRELEINLWPEFDEPEMLVIYFVQLDPDTPLPANLTFRIPTAAGDPNVVAVGSSREVRGEVTYQREIAEEWAVISLIADDYFIQLEYYDPALDLSSANRHYELIWPGDYAVGDLLVKVQNPVDAQNISATPDLGVGTPGGYGLLYFDISGGSLQVGEEFDLTLDYTKDTNTLSFDRWQLNQLNSTQTSSRGLPTWAIWGLGIIGVGLIMFGVIKYFRDDQPPPRKRPRRRKAASQASSGFVFCHNCGTQSKSGDKFCRDCGTKLRSR